MVPILIALGAFAEAAQETKDPTAAESAFLENVRQLTFVGRRSGESYFSPDGSQLIFQSERDADNPFFQIHIMDLELGDIHRVSPGDGKTTCAWFHPTQNKVLYASTHDDPEALDKQKEELDFRASGKSRRYAWDYDEHYDIYESSPNGQELKNLTNTAGYDAEGSWSPDGQWIVFSSNRHVYSQPLTGKEEELFELDKSSQVDLYIMRADGTQVRRLTNTLGYDGGPFFSPDGSQITWRRFTEDGVQAEVWTMDPDGSNQRAVTRMGVMSWAPYYHPSGDYLIFTTNQHGFGNFELYLVDLQGTQDPVRVTFTDGFDGLPVFSPDGKQLAWTSNRGAKGTSQLFLAQWDDNEARRQLGIAGPDLEFPAAILAAKPDFAKASNPVTTEDMKLHVGFLASDLLEGRMTGSKGEVYATLYIEKYFKSLGLQPAGEGGTYFQNFEFTSGVSLGDENSLSVVTGDGTASAALDKEWRPLAFSNDGPVEESEVVFAGYGIVAKKKDEFEEYDSYTHLDVEDKWVLVFRYLPEGVSQGRRQHLSRFSSLRYKAMEARDRGAKGILFVSGPASKVKDQLIDLRSDASLASTSVAAISISDDLAASILTAGGEDIAALQETLDTGDLMMGISLEGVKIAANVDIDQEKRTGRNVLARLYAGGQPSESAVAIGAHVDHLGYGRASTSLAKPDEKGQIHNGADDNASGTAGVLEIAQFLVSLRDQGRLDMKRDLLFCIWSGEELGILGSAHFADELAQKSAPHPHAPPSINPAIVAYLNLDMIGRLKDSVALQGVGSSSIWESEIEQRNAPVGLPITTSNDSYLPTDATSFFLKGVPVLSAFTGAHEDYHTPRDTSEKINYEGASDISRLFALIGRSLVEMDENPDYIEQEKPESVGARSGLRVYLGTIPDYTQGDVPGLKLSGVSKGGPAEKAGLQAGDIIIELAGKKIENIYDYTYAIDALKIGEPASVTLLRAGEEIKLTLIPGSRE